MGLPLKPHSSLSGSELHSARGVQKTVQNMVQNDSISLTNQFDGLGFRLADVYEKNSGAAGVSNTDLDFDLIDESQFIQEDAVNGTDFVAGVVQLHGISPTMNYPDWNLLINEQYRFGFSLYNDPNSISKINSAPKYQVPSGATFFAPTFDPATPFFNITSGRTIVMADNSSYWHMAISNELAPQGLAYMEVEVVSGDPVPAIGIFSEDLNNPTNLYNSAAHVYCGHYIPGANADSPTYGAGGGYIRKTDSDGYIYYVPTNHSISTIHQGDVLRLLIDTVNNKIWFGLNDLWFSDKDGNIPSIDGSFPLTPFYTTTSDQNQISLGSVDTLNSVSISNSAPANTVLGCLVSFDGRNTWKTVSASVLSSHPGLTDKTNWSSIAQMEAALTNLDTTSYNTLDFAFLLSTSDSAATPSVDQVTLNYDEIGTYELASEDDYEIKITSATETTVKKLSAGTESSVKINIKA